MGVMGEKPQMASGKAVILQSPGYQELLLPQAFLTGPQCQTRASSVLVLRPGALTVLAVTATETAKEATGGGIQRLLSTSSEYSSAGTSRKQRETAVATTAEGDIVFCAPGWSPWFCRPSDCRISVGVWSVQGLRGIPKPSG